MFGHSGSECSKRQKVVLTMTPISFKKVENNQEKQDVFSIRRRVFIEEQNVPEAREVDGLDDQADHYLAFVDHQPVGALRIRFEGSSAKIERVATLKEYRGFGLGRKLMLFVMSDLLKNSSIKTLKLSAQVPVIAFYESLGFHTCSEVYEDAGIEHKDMVMALKN